ncbi:helix-turn-helix domain-containing protein [Streptococcus sp. 10F2]
MMNVGERIKKRRTELGLNADWLAEKIGVSRSTIFRYEKGDIEKMPTETLARIAAALNTSPAYFMGWTDESTSILEGNRSINQPKGGENSVSNYDGDNSTYNFGNSEKHQESMKRLNVADLKLQRSLINKIDELIAIQRETNNKLDMIIELLENL